MTPDRLLYRLVQFNAGILLAAAPCALLPFAWMDAVHREAVGLGSLPDVPITKYMARSLSLVYALHGVVILAVTRNWERFRPAVPVLAWSHVALGCGLIAIDLDAGMPWWWALGEGPGLIGYAAIVLFAYRRASRSDSRVP